MQYLSVQSSRQMNITRYLKGILHIWIQGYILETTIENIENDEDLQNNNDLDSDYDCFGFDQW